jgi:hypothetical protein
MYLGSGSVLVPILLDTREMLHWEAAGILCRYEFEHPLCSLKGIYKQT